MIDPAVVVAWVMLVGLLITGPIALAEGVPAHRPASAWIWLVLAGAGNVAGLVCTYGGLRLGQVALVAPLVSAEGAIAAVIALLAGETLGADVVATLALLAVGVALASVPDRAAHPDTQPEHHAAATRLRGRGGGSVRRQPVRDRPRRHDAALGLGRALRAPDRRGGARASRSRLRDGFA